MKNMCIHTGRPKYRYETVHVLACTTHTGGSVHVDTLHTQDTVIIHYHTCTYM